MRVARWVLAGVHWYAMCGVTLFGTRRMIIVVQRSSMCNILRFKGQERAQKKVNKWSIT